MSDPSIRQALSDAADEALARLEARYMPDPLIEAFWARYHAGVHPTPRTNVQVAADAALVEKRMEQERKTAYQRYWRVLDASRRALRASAADPSNSALAERARGLCDRASAEEREYQTFLREQQA